MISGVHPSSQKDREVFLDVLRGLAIFGILIANLTMGGLSKGPYELEFGPFIHPAIDEQLQFIYTQLIEGKFYSIFSLLFGWGIALQLQRSESKGINGLPILRRRLLFMLLLGAMHMLIWPGDIVLFYAMLGFILLPFRRFSNHTLLVFGAVLIVAPIALYAARMHWPVLDTPRVILQAWAVKADYRLLGIDSEISYIAWTTQADWWDVIKDNLVGVFYRFSDLFHVSRVPKVLALFLIGFVLGRSNFYTNISANKKIIYWIIALGLLIGLPANYLLAYYTEHFSKDYFDLKPAGLYFTITYAVGVAPLAMAYVGLSILSFQTGLGKKLMSIVAPVGRMAFSNYVMHSVVCRIVFLSPGLAYGGKVGALYLSIFAVLLYTFQIILSTLWLKHFQFGPFEWVWRSLTYGRFQPLRKATVRRGGRYLFYK